MTEPCDSTTAVQAAAYVRERVDLRPKVGLILGSGLQALVERLEASDVIPYVDIPCFPRTTVAGHAGLLLFGWLAGLPVVMMQGRAHYYEGYSMAQVSFPVRVMRLLGAETLIVTNAAGGIRPDLMPGDLMAIADHVNLPGLAGHSPLRGPNDESVGPRFPAMSRAYDPGLRQLLRLEAIEQQVPWREGTYVMVGGPSFDTPADIRFLRAIGGDAVGMSTVPEVIVARHTGMRVLGVSLISNVTIDSTEDTVQPEACHEETLEVGMQAVPRLGSLIEGVLARLAALD